ncbi:MAG TPA: HipA domain-containing protein [Rhodanobacteraceae bacterium]
MRGGRWPCSWDARRRTRYLGSYAQIAKALWAFCAPQHVTLALGQLFDQVALSCLAGNGDARLKNFGVIYSDPMANDVRMAPAYDYA